MNLYLNQLAQGEGIMLKILDFLPYPFLVSTLKNDDWHNAFVNQKFIAEIGYTVEEMPTIKEWFEFAYPDLAYRQKVEKAWFERIAKAEEQGSDSVFMQVRIKTRSHGQRWYEVKSLIAGDLQMVAFVNIDRIKSKKESLKQLVENRDRILSILSHDLRGPIVNLYSLSKMALSKQINQNDFLSLMSELSVKAFQTMEFLTSTLEWARSNFNTIKVKLEEIDLKKLVYEVVTLYETQYQRKKINVNITIEPSSMVNADREILTSVLRNLLSNAIKFTGEGGLIQIRAVQRSGFVSLEVTDNGIGMSTEKISGIKTNRYFSDLGTSGEKGLGIGIQLCQNLLTRMNAELEIESELGRGTTMRVLIPT